MRRKLLWRSIPLLFGGALLAPSVALAATPAADLAMARLTDISIGTVSNGTGGQEVRLRFSATIVNIGGVPFELNLQRPDASSEFVVSQRVYDGNGGFSDRQTAATTEFAGDGHLHWHIHNLERYELIRLDNGVKVGTSAKSGFCFFDTTAYRLTLPGAPQAAGYPRDGCGHEDSTSVRMGLSVGWGDTYSASLPNQFINITGLGNGQYRLLATADADGLFAEANESNNATWVDLSISKKGHGFRVRITGYGPSA